MNSPPSARCTSQKASNPRNMHMGLLRVTSAIHPRKFDNSGRDGGEQARVCFRGQKVLFWACLDLAAIALDFNRVFAGTLALANLGQRTRVIRGGD